MLYVAIWYVSIRYEGEGRTAVLMLYVAIWYVSICPIVMRVKEELLCSSFFTLITTGHTKLQHTA